MRNRSNFLLAVILVLSTSVGVVNSASAQARKAGCAPNSPVTIASPEERDALYKTHQQWLDANNLRVGLWSNRTAAEVSKILTDSRRASLCNNDFGKISLSRQIWIGANFDHGNFENADLSDADLSKAQLDDSSFIKATLTGAKFIDANLSKARFNDADAELGVFDAATLQRSSFDRARLTGASFKGATLNRASLQNSDLRSARFIDADLTNAEFTGAKLAGAVFEPKAGQLPPAASFARAQDLERLTFLSSAAALIEMRQEFRNSGLTQEARKITYAIRSAIRQQKAKGDIQDRIDSTFQLIFFEWPSDYGLAVGRPLIILVLGVFVFTAPYYAALRWPRTDGIWRIWPKDRARADLGGPSPELIRATGVTAVCFAFYFSLLSAFHLGWRELNVGTWLSRIQPKEYALVATGWIRTVAGFQSILSVYLVALWALSYFGQPFG